MKNLCQAVVLVLASMVILCSGALGFAPHAKSSQSSAPLILQPARIVPSTRFVSHAKKSFRMSSSDTEEESTQMTSPPTSGTFYDDEVSFPSLRVVVAFANIDSSSNYRISGGSHPHHQTGYLRFHEGAIDA